MSPVRATDRCGVAQDRSRPDETCTAGLVPSGSRARPGRRFGLPTEPTGAPVQPATRPASRLSLFVLAVIVAGAAVVLDVVWRHLPARFDVPSAVVLVLAALLLVAESQPIVISREDTDLDEVT